jgi:hypothetical protein
LAQARILLNETELGYPEHYWYALGHLAEAEDELVGAHPALAGVIRKHRKELELYPRYRVPFKELILKAANFGGYDLDELLRSGNLSQEDG